MPGWFDSMSQEFWLGERSGDYYHLDDFDGRPRRCEVIKTVDLTGYRGGDVADTGLVVRVRPELGPGTMDPFEYIVILGLGLRDTAVPQNGFRWVEVYGVSTESPGVSDLSPIAGLGCIARTKDELPPNPDDRWRENLAQLKNRLVEGREPDRVETRLVQVDLDSYRRGTLPAWQAAELESIDGWDWGMPRWEEILEDFVKREGHADVPDGHVENGYRLGMWVAVTRDQREFLAPVLIRFLEGLSGWTWERG